MPSVFKMNPQICAFSTKKLLLLAVVGNATEFVVGNLRADRSNYFIGL